MHFVWGASYAPLLDGDINYNLKVTLAESFTLYASAVKLNFISLASFTYFVMATILILYIT